LGPRTKKVMIKGECSDSVDMVARRVDVVYFPSLTGAEFRRLELAFNACTRYVYGHRRFDHISEFSRETLGVHCSNNWNFDWLDLFIRK
jgi:hypothetical protein